MMSDDGPSSSSSEAPSTKPQQVPSLWWVDIGASSWSAQERGVRSLLAVITGVAFFLLWLLEMGILLKLRVDAHVIAILGFFFAFIPALLLARPICALLWPDILSKAEQKVQDRLAKEGEETS